MQEPISRRRYLRIAGVATGTAVVAGCSTASSSSGDGSGDGSDGSGDGSDGSGGSGSDGSGGGSDGSGGSEWTETSTVEMTAELKYEPKRIQVSKGTEVTWKTTGSIGHTVTAYEDEIPDGADYFASGGFDSEKAANEGYSDGKGNVAKGESYSHTFETTGTYKYYCIPHEMNGMVGYVKVV